MGAYQDGPRVDVETIAEWQRRLVENHASAAGGWLVSWRTATGRPKISPAKRIMEAAEKAGRGERAR